jgi:ABC-type ATPase involved in cell division
MLIVALLRLSCVVAAANALSALSPPRHDGSSFTVLPSRIELDQVSQHFPLTLQRRLFSSVPYREWALRDVTFAAESELLVLTGASSSGKTTILQTIRHGQDRQPTAGCVTISSSSIVQSGSASQSLITASPIYLDQRPPFERSRSIAKIVMDEGQTGNNNKIPALILQQLTNDLLVLVDLESRKNQTPAELSPSEQYRLELARASLTSMLSKYEHSSSDDTPVLLPAPILLADEWLDKETSLVVQAVQASMKRLIHQLGAVILVATHKPERWSMSACSHMKLAGGKIVSFRRPTMATKSITAT